MTKSQLKAGAFTAGDALAAVPVAALLSEVRAVAEADALAPILDRRLADAIAAREAHGAPDPLAEDAALTAHAATAEPLDREVARCQAAVERLAALRAEFAQAEAAAQAETDRRAAEKLQGQGINLLQDLDALAAKFAAGLDRYRALCSEMQSLHAGVHLPHAAASESDRTEQREVVDRQGEVGSYTASGARTDGQPVRFTEIRRTETLHHRGRKARDPRLAEIVLPGFIDDQQWHVRQA